MVKNHSFQNAAFRRRHTSQLFAVEATKINRVVYCLKTVYCELDIITVAVA